MTMSERSWTVHNSLFLSFVNKIILDLRDMHMMEEKQRRERAAVCTVKKGWAEGGGRQGI